MLRWGRFARAHTKRLWRLSIRSPRNRPPDRPTVRPSSARASSVPPPRPLPFQSVKGRGTWRRNCSTGTRGTLLRTGHVRTRHSFEVCFTTSLSLSSTALSAPSSTVPTSSFQTSHRAAPELEPAQPSSPPPHPIASHCAPRSSSPSPTPRTTPSTHPANTWPLS